MKEIILQKSNFRCRENIYICRPLRRLRRLAVEYVKKSAFVKNLLYANKWLKFSDLRIWLNYFLQWYFKNATYLPYNLLRFWLAIATNITKHSMLNKICLIIIMQISSFTYSNVLKNSLTLKYVLWASK